MKINVPLCGELIWLRPLPNPGDHYLRMAMCHCPDQYQPWVTWMLNTMTGGFCWGHYFATREEAIQDFWERKPHTDPSDIRTLPLDKE